MRSSQTQPRQQVRSNHWRWSDRESQLLLGLEVPIVSPLAQCTTVKFIYRRNWRRQRRREEPCIQRKDGRVCIFCGVTYASLSLFSEAVVPPTEYPKSGEKNERGKPHGGIGSRGCQMKKVFFRQFRDELIRRGEWNHTIVEMEPDSQSIVSEKWQLEMLFFV